MPLVHAGADWRHHRDDTILTIAILDGRSFENHMDIFELGEADCILGADISSPQRNLSRIQKVLR